MKKFLLIFAIWILSFGAPGASAHSTLVSSVPSADATVVDFPMEVTLSFNEELLKVGEENPNRVEVFDESGALVSGVSVLKELIIFNVILLLILYSSNTFFCSLITNGKK